MVKQDQKGVKKVKKGQWALKYIENGRQKGNVLQELKNLAKFAKLTNMVEIGFSMGTSWKIDSKVSTSGRKLFTNGVERYKRQKWV